MFNYKGKAYILLLVLNLGWWLPITPVNFFLQFFIICSFLQLREFVLIYEDMAT